MRDYDIVWLLGITITGDQNGHGNHAQLDNTYSISCKGIARPASQTSQTGPGKRPRMYTMQTARAVEDSGVHAEMQWCILTQSSHKIAQQTLTVQTCPTCDGSV